MYRGICRSYADAALVLHALRSIVKLCEANGDLSVDCAQSFLALMQLLLQLLVVSLP